MTTPRDREQAIHWLHHDEMVGTWRVTKKRGRWPWSKREAHTEISYGHLCLVNAERIVDALLPQPDPCCCIEGNDLSLTTCAVLNCPVHGAPDHESHPEPLLRAVADAIEAECPDGKTYSAMWIADVALGAVRKLVPQPDTEWREAIELLSDALGVAMLTLQDFVDGKGPRGHALLPLLLLADAAADKRDEVLAPRNDPTSDPTGVENASADGGSGC